MLNAAPDENVVSDGESLLAPANAPPPLSWAFFPPEASMTESAASDFEGTMALTPTQRALADDAVVDGEVIRFAMVCNVLPGLKHALGAFASKPLGGGWAKAIVLVTDHNLKLLKLHTPGSVFPWRRRRAESTSFELSIPLDRLKQTSISGPQAKIKWDGGSLELQPDHKPGTSGKALVPTAKALVHAIQAAQSGPNNRDR
jgi:hypothetical protein